MLAWLTGGRGVCSRRVCLCSPAPPVCKAARRSLPRVALSPFPARVLPFILPRWFTGGRSPGSPLSCAGAWRALTAPGARGISRSRSFPGVACVPRGAPGSPVARVVGTPRCGSLPSLTGGRSPRSAPAPRCAPGSPLSCSGVWRVWWGTLTAYSPAWLPDTPPGVRGTHARARTSLAHSLPWRAHSRAGV